MGVRSIPGWDLFPRTDSWAFTIQPQEGTPPLRLLQSHQKWDLVLHCWVNVRRLACCWEHSNCSVNKGDYGASCKIPGLPSSILHPSASQSHHSLNGDGESYVGSCRESRRHRAWLPTQAWEMEPCSLLLSLVHSTGSFLTPNVLSAIQSLLH